MKKPVVIAPLKEHGKTYPTEHLCEDPGEAMKAVAADGYDTVAAAQHPLTDEITVFVSSMKKGEPRECKPGKEMEVDIIPVAIIPITEEDIEALEAETKMNEELRRGEGRN